MENERPKVGVGVIIKKDGKVLLGERKNAHGQGSWGFPGGHLEFGETPEDCARREVLEETGLIVDNFKRSYFTNDVFETEHKHYVTIFITIELTQGEPEIKEPHKCTQWQWFKWDKLPSPLFVPIQNLLKENFNPFS